MAGAGRGQGGPQRPGCRTAGGRWGAARSGALPPRRQRSGDLREPPCPPAATTSRSLLTHTGDSATPCWGLRRARHAPREEQYTLPPPSPAGPRPPPRPSPAGPGPPAPLGAAPGARATPPDAPPPRAAPAARRPRPEGRSPQRLSPAPPPGPLPSAPHLPSPKGPRPQPFAPQLLPQLPAPSVRPFPSEFPSYSLTLATQGSPETTLFP